MAGRREFIKQATGIAGIAATAGAPAFIAHAQEHRDVSMDEALEVHNRMLIIDGHNDTPVKRVDRGERPLEWRTRNMEEYHTDIPRMQEVGYDAAFMIVGNGPTADVWVTTELVLEEIEEHPDVFVKVLKSEDVLDAHESGRIGIIVSIEGIGRWLDGNVETLYLLHRLGLRLAGISHGEGGEEPHFLQGEQSPYSHATHEERESARHNTKGLTDFGREILRASNDLGLVTDLSHINDKAFYETIELSELPPIMSHTAVYELGRHWRCMTDDQMHALADAGGVMGIAFAPDFIHPTSREEATVDRFVEHIIYARDLIGIDHVGIGTDFDGLGHTPVVPELSQIPNLTKSMLEHGMSEEEIEKVWGGNFLRILQNTIDTV